MKKLIIWFALLLTLNGAIVRANTVDKLPLKAAIAVELRTGKILYEQNADETLPVAGLSRLLTLYLVYEAVADGKTSWEEQVTVSDYAYEVSLSPDVPNVVMTKDSYSVRDLTKASLISASSSASIALAEHVAGSEQEAVKRMGALLDKWGIKKATIINASGLTNGFLGDYHSPDHDSDVENRLSARDLAIISSHLLTDFPEVLELSEATQGNFGGQYVPTYNYLLENMPYARRDTHGLVTGTSEAAGSSLISFSYENQMQVLTVFLNVDKGLDDPDRRFVVANQFLDQLGNTFHLQKVLPANTSYKDTPAPVLDGVKATVPAVTQDDFFVVTTPETIDRFKLKTVFPDKTTFAPIEEGQVVGQVVFDDQVLVGQGYLGDLPRMDLIAEEPVERTNLFQIMWNSFVRYVIDYL